MITTNVSITLSKRFAKNVSDDQHPSSVANTNEQLVGVIEKRTFREYKDTGEITTWIGSTKKYNAKKAMCIAIPKIKMKVK